jgi:DHA2 family multidrug resistance protein
VRTDFVGLILLAIMIVCLQIVLDQGNELDWLSSHMIVYLAIISLASAVAFFWRGALLGEANIVNLGLFRDINFAVCSGLVAVIGCVFLALLIVTPEMLVTYFRWEIQSAGLVIGTGGVTGMVGAMVSGRLVPFVGGRVVIIAGLSMMALGWYLYSRLTFGASPMQVIIPVSLIMFGMLLTLPVLAAQAFQNLLPDQRDEGAGLFNFVKTMGFSIGVAATDTFLYRGTQQNWSLHAGQVSPQSPPLMALGDNGVTPEVMSLVGVEMGRQMGMVTIVQLAESLFIFALICLPLAFMLRSSPR